MTSAASAASPTAGTLDAQRAPLSYHPDSDPDVTVVFTGRHDDSGATANLSLVVGDGDVLAARRDALRRAGADPAHAVFMQQVHGGGVARVDTTDAGRGVDDHADAIAGVDGLVTSASDLALAVLVADCVPVVLIDPGADIAAVHAGRGGVVAEVVSAAVATMSPRDRSRVVAVVGPAIGGCCYEVPAEMAAQVTRRWPQAAGVTAWGTPSLDLPAAVTAQLEQAGVGTVVRLGGCTRCSGDTWFSHRATTAGQAPAGRQAGIVVRASTPGARTAPDQSPTTRSLQSP